MTNQLEKLSEHRSFGGTVGVYQHVSEVNHCDMRFALFQPPQAKQQHLPVLTCLAGLTCTEETFMVKSGAQRIAAELGIILLAPDTSPRGEGVPDDPDGAYDFGLGAGFYLNATEDPWNEHYHMYDYVTRELPALVFASFPADASRQGITGHSMGGHGALTLGLKNPDIYRSISAFAPICNPIECPWGQKAMSNYLGEGTSAWKAYDATELARTVTDKPQHKILIDQGLADQYLAQELRPHKFMAACEENDIAVEVRNHEGYDHGYYFISTFVEDHLRHHAQALNAGP